MPPRLKERYKSEIVPELMREFSYRNIMQVPRVEKVTLNIGLGEAKENARAVETATADLATISGQTSDRYPEGIAWDPTRQAFLVGSVATGRISVVGRDGSSRVLAQAPGVSTFGLHVDGNKPAVRR